MATAVDWVKVYKVYEPFASKMPVLQEGEAKAIPSGYKLDKSRAAWNFRTRCQSVALSPDDAWREYAAQKLEGIKYAEKTIERDRALLTYAEAQLNGAGAKGE